MKRGNDDEPVYQQLSALSLEYPSDYSHRGCNNWNGNKGIVSIVKEGEGGGK